MKRNSKLSWLNQDKLEKFQSVKQGIQSARHPICGNGIAGVPVEVKQKIQDAILRSHIRQHKNEGRYQSTSALKEASSTQISRQEDPY